MISVLARTAVLVELLAKAGAAGHALRDIAARASLPPATATRLLHDLCELGWADQQGLRGRYRLGPHLQALGERRHYRGRLLAAATPVLTALARRQQARVVLAVLRRGRRLALLELGDDSLPNLSERDDLYASASGRMLIAQLPWRLRRRLIEAAGLPGTGQWPEAATWSELNSQCAEARRRGWCENHPRGNLVGVGVAVPDDEGGVAAIGVAVERARWGRTVIDAARRAAAQITRRLDAAASTPSG